jgi:hypothetical protein
VIETDLARRGAESLCEERTRERDVSLATLEKLQQEHRSLAGAHDEERRLHDKAAETLRASWSPNIGNWRVPTSGRSANIAP